MSTDIFKQNLNRIVQEQKITQRQLSVITGLSAAAICQILNYNNKRSVSANTLEKIANAVGCTMDELYRGGNEKQIN